MTMLETNDEEILDLVYKDPGIDFDAQFFLNMLISIGWKFHVNSEEDIYDQLIDIADHLT